MLVFCFLLVLHLGILNIQLKYPPRRHRVSLLMGLSNCLNFFPKFQSQISKKAKIFHENYHQTLSILYVAKKKLTLSPFLNKFNAYWLSED